MTPTEVTRAFIEEINAHTLDGLYELMTEDHTFVDGGGAVTQGRKAMRDAWQGYFSMMPDYLIAVEHVLATGNIVGVFGKASGTYTSDGRLKHENSWQVPAAWLAIIRDGKVVHWQVYADNDSVSRIIAKEQKR
ncbi:MAG: nuclear transport factor 2 family protein [Bacteroidota bacterium]